MTTQATKEKQTITLTGRAPVRIVKDEWPIIARAYWHDGQVECQANRRFKLFVRQHDDGRTIVYGIYNTQYQGEPDRRGGEMLTPPDGANISPDDYFVWDEIPAAIQRVGEYLGFDQTLIDECIADLPAEDL